MFLTRRLSQRPTAEELEQRNILKREFINLVDTLSLSCYSEFTNLTKNVTVTKVPETV